RIDFSHQEDVWDARPALGCALSHDVPDRTDGFPCGCTDRTHRFFCRRGDHGLSVSGLQRSSEHIRSQAGPIRPGSRDRGTIFPTGTSSPSAAVTLARTPSAGASSSTVALSVSTSTTGSPFFTGCPSRLSHCTILPVSCAIPSTGKIISVAMIALLPLHDAWTGAVLVGVAAVTA